MGEKVLRDVLTKETEPPKDAQRKALSTENYDFQLLGDEIVDGRRCFLLSMNPRREEKDAVPQDLGGRGELQHPPRGGHSSQESFVVDP